MSAPRQPTREDHCAGNAVVGLAGVYSAHVLYVGFVFVLNRELSAGDVALPIIALIAIGLVVWGSVSVRRGGQMIVAATMSTILLGGGTTSLVFILKQFAMQRPLFAGIQVIMILWATTALILLVIAKQARRAVRRDNG